LFIVDNNYSISYFLTYAHWARFTVGRGDKRSWNNQTQF